MKKLLILLCLTFKLLAQNNHPGYFYQDSSITSIGQSKVRSNGDVVALTAAIPNYYLFISDSIYQNISIINKSINRRDTIIWLPLDTSSKYFLSVTHHYLKNDTSHFLGVCRKRTPNQWWTNNRPTNVFSFYLTPQNTLSPFKYLFPEDSLGTLPFFGNTSLKFNDGLFELMDTRYDSILSSYQLFLAKYTDKGQLTYFKTWDYTYPWSSGLLIASDFYRLSNGNYLVTQQNQNDIYFFADTSSSSIDTAYFDNPTRGLCSIIDLPNKLLLFGKSDGYSFQSMKDGKSQYLFWELNKNDFSEINRKVVRLKDTVEYDFGLSLSRDPIIQFDNGDFIFTAIEHSSNKLTNALSNVIGIYCADSLYQLKWSYRLADTLYQDGFGLPMIEAIPNNQTEFIWYIRYGDDTYMSTSKVWFQKIKLDGSNLGIESLKLNELQSISIYPNPASTACDILLPFLPDNKVQVQIINTKGQVVFEHDHNQRDNLIRLNFDLAPGTYTVSVSTTGYQASQQLLIQ